MPPTPAGDEEFTEVDLSHPEGRVVWGAATVELARPAVRTAVPKTPASDGPFTEIIVGDEPEEPAEVPAEESAEAAPVSGTPAEEGVVVTVESNKRSWSTKRPSRRRVTTR